jgi:hypothetical protein
VAAAGGAVVVDDDALDGAGLAGAVAPLLADPDRLAAMAAAMHTLAHPDAAEELAALVVEASGRVTREAFLASRATPVDREATGWFEAAAAPAGGPTVQRRIDHRSKRMEAYPPIDRAAQPRSGAPANPGGSGAAGVPATPAAPGGAGGHGNGAVGPARTPPAEPGAAPDTPAAPEAADKDSAEGGGDPPGDGGATR